MSAAGEVTVGPGTFWIGLGNRMSIGVADSVLVGLYVFDPTRVTLRNVVAPTVISLSSSANINFVSGVPNSAPLTSITVPADASTVMVYIKGVTPGTATLSLSAPTYTTQTASITVTP